MRLLQAYAGAALALFGVFRAITLGTGTDVAVVVAVSLVAAVLIGNLAGVILPFAARALRFDPAIVSGPFITYRRRRGGFWSTSASRQG